MKLTNHVVIRPQRGEGRLIIIGGRGGGGEFGQFWGEVELFGGGGKLPLPPPPPPPPR